MTFEETSTDRVVRWRYQGFGNRAGQAVLVGVLAWVATRSPLTLAWLAAARCTGLAAASCYYGRLIADFADEQPRCPTILHFGKTDASIPMSVVDGIGEAHPEVPIYRYDAGHGFFSDRRADFNADCARLARLRTLQLFQKASGARGEHG